jgi:hypothetical protein
MYQIEAQLEKAQKELMLVLLLESQLATYYHGENTLDVGGYLRFLPETTPLTHVFPFRHKCTVRTSLITLLNIPAPTRRRI